MSTDTKQSWISAVLETVDDSAEQERLVRLYDYDELVKALLREGRELTALRADAVLLDWIGSLGTDTDITICPPGNHGGPADKWLVSIDDDNLTGPLIEAYGDTPRAALAAAAKLWEK